MSLLLKTIALAAITLGFYAQQSFAAIVAIEPLSKQALVGDEFELQIVGKQFPELRGGQIDLKIDSRIIQIKEVQIDPIFDFQPESGSFEALNQWKGIKFDLFINTLPASGNFTIATLTLEALAPGLSTVTFLDSSSFFGETRELFPQRMDSQVTVSAVPLPAAWLLLLSGVLGWRILISRHQT